MNRIFYAMVLVAFLAAAWRQATWVPPEVAPAAAPAPTAPDALAPGEADARLAQVRAELSKQVGDVAKRIDRHALFVPDRAKDRAPMQALSDGMLDTAKTAFTLVLGLVGGMSLFLGVMKVAEAGGLLTVIAGLIRPLLVRLFPDVPADHPAMGAMLLNLSANALGLGNAATPFGIRAMQELDKLNPLRGTATNAMAMFLAINTSNVTLVPTNTIVWRSSVGSHDPAGILPTTLFATVCSMSCAIGACKLLERFSAAPKGPTDAAPSEAVDAPPGYPLWVSGLALFGLLLAIPLTIAYGQRAGPWIVPTLVFGLLTWGAARGAKVYEAFVTGAKEGLESTLRITPYLVAILVAVNMLQTSGALDLFTSAVGPYTAWFGLPAEALPMALLRPLSGSGATGVMVAAMQTWGADSYVGYLVSTIQGSSETTFYVLAVYFGAVGVQRLRHALIAALVADLAGLAGSIVAVRLYFAYRGLPM